MPFTANIPQPGDLISDSQSQLLDNNQTLSTVWNVNHTDFNAADPGKHKFLSLPEVSVPPVSIANEMILFVDDNNSSGVVQSEMYIERESAAETFPFTGGRRNANGFMYTPNGMIVKWGSATVTTGTSTDVTLTAGAGIPNYTTAVYAIQLAGARTDASWVPLPAVDTLTPPTNPLTQIRVIALQSNGSTGSSATIYYWVIGI